jgi:hypothetical protein
VATEQADKRGQRFHDFCQQPQAVIGSRWSRRHKTTTPESGPRPDNLSVVPGDQRCAGPAAGLASGAGRTAQGTSGSNVQRQLGGFRGGTGGGSHALLSINSG